MSVGPGAVIAGDFRLVSPLAQGGMGEVWIAEQLSTGRRRALKLMKRELVSDPSLIGRFEQEARIGSRVASEHVVEVVGAGVDRTTGMPWLAMELLEGESLESLVRRRGPLPPAEARALFAQLGHGLSAAHRAGVVHRDLKPENVFVGRPQQVGVQFKVKILDFGIAKLFDEARSGATGAMSLGTPRWMAPEQTGGQAISTQTDVWAFGLLAFWALTGRYYWKRGVPGPNDSVMTLMREVLFEPLAPASRRAQELGVGHLIPPGFDAWFARCVSREVRERYPEAGAAAQALEEVLARAPTPPIDVAPTLATATPAKRSRSATGWMAAIVALVVLGSLGAGLVVWAPWDDGSSRSRRRSSDDEDDEPAPKKRPPVATASTATAPPAAPARGVAGLYDIVVGLNPPGGGAPYSGTVELVPQGMGYRVIWSVGYEGIGLEEGKVLAVGWGQGTYGLSIFRLDGGVLGGRTTMSGDGGRTTSLVLQGPAGLDGSYTIVKSSDGVRGSVVVRPLGETYDLLGTFGGSVYEGTGLRSGDRLYVGWSARGQGGGVVVYDVRGPELDGRWAPRRSSALGREVAKKR